MSSRWTPSQRHQQSPSWPRGRWHHVRGLLSTGGPGPRHCSCPCSHLPARKNSPVLFVLISDGFQEPLENASAMPKGICAPSHCGVQPQAAVPHAVALRRCPRRHKGPSPPALVTAPQAAKPPPRRPRRGAAAGGTAGGQQGGRQELH